jgi:hypothetical protein
MGRLEAADREGPPAGANRLRRLPFLPEAFDRARSPKWCIRQVVQYDGGLS